MTTTWTSQVRSSETFSPSPTITHGHHDFGELTRTCNLVFEQLLNFLAMLSAHLWLIVIGSGIQFGRIARGRLDGSALVRFRGGLQRGISRSISP